MAREYARIRISIADDEDFENLSAAAQWLYLRVLIPDPTLNQCGIADWRPNRLVGKARGVTLDFVLAAAAELEVNRYALFDTDTEEVLVRSYIRSDELLRNPKMAVSVVKAFRSIASKTLRAAVVSEVKKDRAEHPDYSSWTAAGTKDDLAQLMTRSDLESVGYTNRISNGESINKTNPITNQNSDVHPGADYQSDSVPIPCSLQPAPTPITLQPDGGYVSGDVTTPDPNDPPPPRCPKHIDTPAPGNCGPCGDARRARADWDTRRANVSRTRGAERREAIRDCELCDEGGWRIPPPEYRDVDLPVIKCDHTPMDDDGWLGLIPDEVSADA